MAEALEGVLAEAEGAAERLLREMGGFRPFAVTAARDGVQTVVDTDIDGSAAEQLAGLDDYIRGRGEDLAWAVVVVDVAVQDSDAVQMAAQIRGGGVHRIVRLYEVSGGEVCWGRYLRVAPGEPWWPLG